jgi:enamine deaminase RidA (YjgF/YER057c/UK114 family)
VAQAYRNVNTALAAVGGTFDDVARLTVYVVDWSPEKLADLGAGVGQVAAELAGDPVRPTTLIGVAALGEPDLLVEVEAVAVLD